MQSRHQCHLTGMRRMDRIFGKKTNIQYPTRNVQPMKERAEYIKQSILFKNIDNAEKAQARQRLYLGYWTFLVGYWIFSGCFLSCLSCSSLLNTKKIRQSYRPDGFFKLERRGITSSGCSSGLRSETFYWLPCWDGLPRFWQSCPGR